MSPSNHNPTPSALIHPPLRPEIQRILSQLESLPYFERRLKISRIFNPRPARFLYKYIGFNADDETSIDRARDILVRSRLWLSSPEDFNDPFDMSIKIIITGPASERKARLKEICKSQGMKWKDTEERVKQLMRKGRDHLERSIQDAATTRMNQNGIYSFAGGPRNILMWSHYARNHTGVCIIFEVAQDVMTFFQTLPVEYSEDYPIVNWTNNFEEEINKALLKKHEGWKYEQERRILRIGEARSYLSFKPDSLVGLIYGCRIPANSLLKLKELVKERKDARLPTFSVYEAKKHESEFKLSILRKSPS